MADGKHGGALGAVYEAKGADEVAALYDRWSETYDHEMAVAGYRHPSICLALLARHLPRGASPLLDAGAGTGLIGEWLGIMGYPDVEALDISEGMLAKAAEKGAYKAFHRLALGGPLPFADGHFAGIVSAGVFTSGHVGVEGLDELVRICRAGGVIVLPSRIRCGTAASRHASPSLKGRGSSSASRRPRPMSRCPAKRARCRAVGWC